MLDCRSKSAFQYGQASHLAGFSKTHTGMRTEIAVLGRERWRGEVALPGKADTGATGKVVSLGDFQFLKPNAHVRTQAGWRCTPAVIPIPVVSSGKVFTRKELCCPAGLHGVGMRTPVCVPPQPHVVLHQAWP